MAITTQMQSQRSPNTPADIFPDVNDAVFARSTTKTNARVASVHVTPITNGPLAPNAVPIVMVTESRVSSEAIIPLSRSLV